LLRLINDSSEIQEAFAAADVPDSDDPLLDAYSRTIIDVAEHPGRRWWAFAGMDAITTPTTPLRPRWGRVRV
jgi:hypothetical protein